MKKILLLSLLFCAQSQFSFSQINQGGLPESFKLEKHGLSLDENYDVKSFLTPNRAEIDAEDFENSEKGNPFRIAVNIEIDLNISTAGTWTVLSNGDKIWRLGISVPNAKALSLYFEEELVIPDGGKLFAYNQNHIQHVGAYTSKTPMFTSMEMIQGELLTLEYYMPSNSTTLPIIRLDKIAYYYRGVGERIESFKNQGRLENDERAGNCQIDVACSEINGWEPQRDAVVKYTFAQGLGTFLCSGSIMNNTANDCKPYVLSANHCGEPTSNSNIADHIWYFNYQRPSCSPGNTTPYSGAQSQTMSGGFFRASSELGTHPPANTNQVTGCDFVLLELGQTIPSAYGAYYAGWNRGNSASGSGVSIHHPSGHEKKISTYTSNLSTTTYNGGWSGAHWLVTWVGTANGHGVTEGGSSGSPIFNANGQAVGHLSGGASFCTATSSPDLFGKFNRAWDQDGNNSSSQLKSWLDPGSTGQTSINGTYAPCGGTGGTVYCTATSTTCDEYISSVVLGGVSNTTLCDNYSLFWENTPVGVIIGSSYLLEVTTGVINSTTIGYTGDQIAAWIDWNGDGDFDDSNESVLSHVISSTTTMPVQSIITVPNNAYEGEIRMRVRNTYDEANEGLIEPCGTSEYGEVEDYLLSISELASLSAETTEYLNIYPNPASDYLFIDLKEMKSKVVSIIIVDISGRTIYQNTSPSDLIELNMENEAKGVYFVKVKTDKDHIIKKVILK